MEVGAAAYIDGALAEVCDAIGADFEVARTAFALDTTSGGIADLVVGEDTVVAADVIDAGAGDPAADVVDVAIEDEEIVDAGQFDSVLVSSAADIVDVEIAEDHEAGGVGIGVLAAVIAVDAILGRITDLEVVQDEVSGASEVNTFGLALDDGFGLAGDAADPDWVRGGAGKVGDVDADTVGAGVDADGGAWGGFLDATGDGGVRGGDRAVAGGVAAGIGIDVDLGSGGFPGFEGGDGGWGGGGKEGVGGEKDGERQGE